ncbi:MULTISPECIES: Xaa-Pro peptidase family protein [Archaeoglobus]|jgi:Xaa-Pro aminopeptidase|uniref:X-pro aminopeptidase (PepQ) n=3 Tax=Archaeoglobus fulgidus TaxID=2234 RepID=O28245_ARCFU|nr:MULTISPECIES: Xaa-Pro peptidase family protein [Archaeoglobus]AAB89220.1 X-pro aminopeptidase (pepQ) [Archaeoglobus fulgidus DSM 4304]AIG99023.1 Xaa-Pro aminopeptidase [Archaeoglobus fulgidus DSM 8774]KUJ92930.1 MAG: X-pro aminopeptidase (PepQ) [Archaeoglobus fulgidus]KUK06409.1 MAG: X-pro aminopeptidase (PepQ) [Archaeoglobus fulgidus]MDI3498596.1 Xaa-Pro aminopeptidase [Archaeoglobus sp.]
MIAEFLRKHSADFIILHGSSSNANFYYATKFKTYDPLTYIAGIDGSDILIVPEMEKKRAERESRVKEIVSLNDLGYMEKLKELGDAKKAYLEILVAILKEGRCRKLLIPEEMPTYISFELMKHFEVEVVKNPFSTLRIIKSSSEVEKIRDTSNAILRCVKWAVENFSFRTCEGMRRAIELKLFSEGYLAENTICSTGKSSADPHEIGKGEIEEHVVLDVFPKSLDHLYYSDFTRTLFVRENAELEEMYKAVVDAQEKALSMIRDGVDAKDVHQAVKDTLNSHGFKTEKGEGFIHSTGHGVGLEVHEEPRISELSVELKKGMVVTVEPGLYYSKVGGVRVEDTVVVRKNGCEVLTPFEKFIKLY